MPQEYTVTKTFYALEVFTVTQDQKQAAQLLF